MDNIDNLKEKMLLEIENQDLQNFSKAQLSLIKKLKNENELLKKKIAELESIVRYSKAIPLSPEELICIEQIELLRQASLKRDLTLEEVKKLDLLVKNLRLIREQATQVVDVLKEGTIDEQQLLSIASEDNNNERKGS